VVVEVEEILILMPEVVAVEAQVVTEHLLVLIVSLLVELTLMVLYLYQFKPTQLLSVVAVVEDQDQVLLL
tara:strand:+ start:69 stop:278 length:210 start_codon:yes stop_codon:yes gene_type:complete